MMAMLDLIDDGGELAAHPAAKAPAEDRGNLVCGQPPQAEFAAALEQFMDRKASLENEVAAVLDLGDGVEARQVEPLAFLGGKLRPQHKGPIIEPLSDDVWAQPVSGGLQCSHVINGQEGIVVLAEADLRG